jgi:hypothetical protein
MSHGCFELASAHFPIKRVDAGSMDADEHFAIPYLWAWRFFVQQNFRSAVIVNSDCVHKGCEFPRHAGRTSSALDKVSMPTPSALAVD